MGNRIPTLTTAGWVSDPVTKAVALFDYALECEFSQSNFYQGRITSMPKLVQQYGSRPEKLGEEVGAALQDYLQRYYEEVSVQAYPTELNSSDGRYNLNIRIVVTEDGKSNNFSRLLQIGDSEILNVG